MAILGMVLCCLVSIVSSSAFAEGESQDAALSRPSLQEIEASLDGEGPQPIRVEPTNPQAALELPHDDLNRNEAQELLSAVFGPVLQGTAGVYDELDVDNFHGDHVAVIAPGDQPEAEGPPSAQPTLVESALPLRAKDADGKERPVDLSLESREGELQPANPLVEVGIPAQLGDGILLAETGIEIDLSDAPADRSASTVEEATAFYPNVAPDSDFTVAPTPEGVETFTQLRSSDAPLTQTYALTLPAGSNLKETKSGGAEVLNGGQPIMAVPAPTALDAQGLPVPVRLEVAGSSIVVTTIPDDESTYPILVDPLFQVYTFGQTGAQGKPDFTGWSTFNTNSGAFFTAISDWCPACNDIVYGLEINSYIAGGIPIQSRARWDYMVPRWGQDHGPNGEVLQPSTYIDGLQFGRLYFDVMEPENNYAIVDDPLFEFYLWDDSLGFVAIGRRLGTEGDLSNLSYQYILKNPNHNPNTKRASLELVTTQPHSQNRHLYVGDATMELSDNDYPRFAEKANPPNWVNNSPTSPIYFSVTDKGLGVYNLYTGERKTNGEIQYIGTHYKSCTGGVGSPCPRTWTSTQGPAMNYDPSLMPQGENWVTLDATDPLNHNSSLDPELTIRPEAKIKVDHTRPALALSGNLTEQGAVGTQLSNYTLKYRVTDGTHTAAEALAPFGTQGTSNGQMQRPLGIATDRAGHVWMVDREGNRIEEFDEEGHYLGQFGSKGSGNGQLLEPSNIVRTAAGNLWVTDTGNHRVQEFTASGQYIQQFGTSGSGGGTQFLAPFGIAATSDGMLWVSDTSTGRVGEFRETVGEGVGRFVRNATGGPGNPQGGTQLNAPAGLAVDSQNNLWVVDNGNHRLQRFNSQGVYVSTFGAQGTGPGQLKSPYNVAISAVGNLLVTDAGNNRIEEFQPSGTFVRQFGAQGMGSGQFTEPRALAFGAGNTVFVDDAGNHRITRWQNAELDPQSGAAGIQIKVDGAVAKEESPGCATRDCEINSEWLLESLKYASGQHTVEVIATDGVGLTTTKSITITTVKDTTKPKWTAISSYFTPPKGWMEQKTYSYSTSVSDVGGYGVTSLVFKIDGKAVNTVAQSCAGGGCGATLAGSINMAAYKGGAHPAELVATDAAGNTSKLAATFNVNPKGNITAGEVEDTLEAVEKTSDQAVVAPDPALENPHEEEGPPILEQTGSTIRSEGAPVESTMTTSSNEGFQLKTSEGTVSITPVGVGGSATQVDITLGAGAAVAGNTGGHVDTVIRPIYDGTMTFQNIRDVSAAEEYTWKINMFDEQVLKQIDSQTAEVYEEDEAGIIHPAFGIRAELAHDVLGVAVPTTLTVSGSDTVTLTIHHRAGNPSAGNAPFTYPVIAGAGWEGGFQTYIAEMPPPEPLAQPAGTAENVFFGWTGVSPPEPIGGGDSEAVASGFKGVKKHFVHVECSHTYGFYAQEPLSTIDHTIECGNPFQNKPGNQIAFRGAFHGKYFLKEGVQVWHEGGPNDGIGCVAEARPNATNAESGVAWKQRRAWVDRCVWWGATSDGGGQSAPYGKHITPVGQFVGESRGGCGDNCGGTPNPWDAFDFPPMAFYLWASGHAEFHETDCIDCY